MKASELRIGNLLEFSNGIQETKIITVGRRFFSSAAIDKEDGDFEITPYYKPIPLTEQWLVKMGFINDEFISYRWYKEWNGVVIMAYDLDDNCVKVSDDWEFPPRHYVHQLQNLYYALTNEELTLNK